MTRLLDPVVEFQSDILCHLPHRYFYVVPIFPCCCQIKWASSLASIINSYLINALVYRAIDKLEN
jgi:hypothetical protein